VAPVSDEPEGVISGVVVRPPPVRERVLDRAAFFAVVRRAPRLTEALRAAEALLAPVRLAALRPRFAALVREPFFAPDFLLVAFAIFAPPLVAEDQVLLL
jgi:hypothetical protein